MGPIDHEGRILQVSFKVHGQESLNGCRIVIS